MEDDHKRSAWNELLKDDSIRTHVSWSNQRVKDTGRSFMECGDVRDWLDGEVKVLACKGIAGVGKTFLAFDSLLSSD